MKYVLFSLTISLSLISLSLISLAEEPADLSEIFMVYPGRAAPLNWSSEGPRVPGTQISSKDIPISAKQLSSVFHDAHVWMLGENRNVVGLRANRTYSDSKRCEADLIIAAKVFEASLNEQPNATPKEIKYLSSNGNVRAQLACRGIQFPTLSLTFEHIGLGQEVENEFGR
jgi:hypothetical protein